MSIYLSIYPGWLAGGGGVGSPREGAARRPTDTAGPGVMFADAESESIFFHWWVARGREPGAQSQRAQRPTDTGPGVTFAAFADAESESILSLVGTSREGAGRAERARRPTAGVTCNFLGSFLNEWILDKKAF